MKGWPRSTTRWVSAFIAILSVLFTLSQATPSAAYDYLYAPGGVWVLYQPTGSTASAMITDLNNKRTEIQNALTANDGIVGFSCRIPWKQCDNGDFSVFDTAADIAHDVNKLISIRFMAGKHTPARVLNLGNCYSVYLGADRVPVPMNPNNGTPGNPGFEAEYAALIADLQHWCVANNAGLLHLAWYGHLWAELKGDEELRDAIDAVGGAGTFTAARWRDGHLNLIDIAFNNTATPVAIEWAASGHVSLVGSVTAALWDSIRTHTGSDWSKRAYIQTNNIGGQWGIAGNPGAGRAVRKAGQMVGSGGMIYFTWPAIFDALRGWGGTVGNIENGDCRYLEVYLPSFTGDDPTVLKSEALDWYDEVYEDYEAPNPVTNFTATPGNGQIQLNWNNPGSDWTGTRIQRSTTGYPGSPTSGTNRYDAAGNSFLDTGLTNGVMYYYSAFAHDAFPNYSTSTGVAATPQASNTIVTFESQAANDGWILESSETSGKGGSVSATGNAGWSIRVGDEGADMQYKSILSFNTSSLPDSANIVSATLKIKREELAGTNPWTWGTTCYADIKTGYFGTAATLAASDWEAAATNNMVATMSNPTTDGAWSTGALGPNGRASINKLSTNGGLTQLRVYINLDDNDNGATDCMGFPSGEFATQSSRPVLEVEYN